jgi:hypothetical protein
MSARYLEAENGLEMLMKQFAPPAIPAPAERINPRAMTPPFAQLPKTPYDWAKFDVCGQGTQTQISDALFHSVFDDQRVGADGEKLKWDDNDNAFNSTLFPVVVRWNTGERGQEATKFRGKVEHTLESHAFPVVYRCCFSMWNPEGTGAIPHDPKFVEIKLHQIDEFGVAQQRQTAHSVMVDTALIGDEHCAKSIVASLENSSVRSGGYLYFFPEVNQQVRTNQNLPFLRSDDHRVSGASLGMAVFAAVQGWPSILYTGYTSFIVPGYKIQHNSQYAQETAIATGKPRPVNYGPASLSWSTPGGQGISVYGDSYVKVAKQIDFVDSVQDLPFKMILAVFHKIPIIIPMSGSFGETTANYIESANKGWKQSLLNFMQLTITMANVERGVDTVLVDAGNRYAKMLFMGKTIGEFMLLAYLAQNAQAVAKGMTAEKDLPRWQGYVKGFEDSWQSDRIKKAMEMKQRMQQYNEPLREYNRAFKEKRITKEQWQDDVGKLQEKRVKVKKAKKAAVKDSQKKNATSRSKIKDAIDAAVENYKEKYALEKLRMGPKPTAKERKLFNQQFPSIAAAKRRLNSTAFKSIVSANLVNDRERGQSSLALASRYNRAEQMAKIDPPLPTASIVAALSVFFPSLPEIPPENSKDNGKLLEYLKGTVTDVMDANRLRNPIKGNAGIYNPPTNAAALKARLAFLESEKNKAIANANAKQASGIPLSPADISNLNNITGAVAAAGQALANAQQQNTGNDDDAAKQQQQFTTPKQEMKDEENTKKEQLPRSLQASQRAKDAVNNKGARWTLVTGVDGKIIPDSDGFAQYILTDASGNTIRNQEGEDIYNKNPKSKKLASMFSGGQFGSKNFGSAYHGKANSNFAGAGRIGASGHMGASGHTRRIINRPQNDMDEVDMSAWNPFSFIKDVANDVMDVAGPIVRTVAGEAARAFVPVAGNFIANAIK